MKADSPYRGNPSETFWKSAVTGRGPGNLDQFYTPRFAIKPSDRIATAGSCFAQHIARHLRSNGYSVIDAEPAPAIMSPEDAARHGFGVYSARFGNIYYVRQLLQLVQEALFDHQPQDYIWEKDGRYYDALRPTVEPFGLESPESVSLHRRQHLKHVQAMLRATDVFVYTFGLTEGWVHIESGTVYPTAPGTVAGAYDPEIYAFKNFTYPEVLADFLEFRRTMANINPQIRFLITVSPVALAATASGDHVLKSTVYSKSVLRAVAGYLAETYSDIDYFPSYDLIASHFTRGEYYDESLRDVTQAGVQQVMEYFFSKHVLSQSESTTNLNETPGAEDILCEEALLEVFGK